MTIKKGTLCAWFSITGKMSSSGVYEITKVTPSKVTLTSKKNGPVSMSLVEFQQAIDAEIWREVPSKEKLITDFEEKLMVEISNANAISIAKENFEKTLTKAGY